MQESGGRRIKRARMIDQNSVRFLSADEIAEARRFTVLQTYPDERGREIEHWNTGRDAPDRRQMTHIGVFRAYVAAYLAAHPGFNHEMTQMVRQLAPGPAGLTPALYCFNARQAWHIGIAECRETACQ